MENANIVYVSYDADSAGRKIGRAILSDRPDQLKEASDRIQLGNEIVAKWANEYNGVDYCSGGDQGVWALPIDAADGLNHLRADYEFATGLTLTIGVGKTLSESGKALLVGKFRGKNQVVQYDSSIEQEILQAQKEAAAGTASAEIKKLSEAYLEPQGTSMNENKSEQAPHDCEYCQAMATEQVDDPSHCKYCHDTPQESEPCQYCDESATNQATETADCEYCKNPTEGSDCKYCKDGNHDATIEGHPDDCQYCKESAGQQTPDANGGTNQEVSPTAGPTVKNPTTTDSENYAGQDLNTPDLPKPEAIQHNPDGLGTSFDAPTNENTKLDAQGQGGNRETNDSQVQGNDPQSEETVQEIAQQIDALPPTAQPQAENVIQTDSADMATGTAMEDGVSRPEDYADENTPRDMGLSEDDGSPDVTSLMQEGLDSHADEIAKEKIVNLVSEALVGFKASKQILEKAKLQAPQLYESSIAMLKAMIEMAKMLGLDQEAGASDSNDPLNSEQSQEGVDQPAEGNVPPAQAHTGEAQNPPKGNLPEYEKKRRWCWKKANGAVGQPIGKLPTSQTTEHVARTPQLPNSLNAKGQKKTIDPVTGRVRWIDMKEGKVLSDTGIPVKPANEEEADGSKIRH